MLTNAVGMELDGMVGTELVDDQLNPLIGGLLPKPNWHGAGWNDQLYPLIGVLPNAVGAELDRMTRSTGIIRAT